jgi:hypothetical protein
MSLGATFGSDAAVASARDARTRDYRSLPDRVYSDSPIRRERAGHPSFEQEGIVKRWTFWIAAVVLAAGLAAPVTALANGGGPDRFSVKGVGTGAWLEGQSFSFTENLYFQGQLVGTDSVACRVFPKAGFDYCHAAFNFGKGTMFVVGRGPSTGPVFNLKIVNGTMDYTNARGTLHVRSGQVDHYTFTFRT